MICVNFIFSLRYSKRVGLRQIIHGQLSYGMYCIRLVMVELKTKIKLWQNLNNHDETLLNDRK